MNISFYETKDYAADAVAQELYLAMQKKPSARIGLSTGETMIPIYKKFISLIQKNPLNLARIHIFNIDEYLNLRNMKKSFSFFLESHFCKPLKRYGLQEENINFISLDNYSTYARLIVKKPFDLLLLGIGSNGHIAFNEPGSSLQSRTRIIYLTEKTRRQNVKHFGRISSVPRRAITLGIYELLLSRKIILTAFGKKKATIVKKAFHDRISKHLPASFLQHHKDTLVILDRDSGSLIKLP